MDGSAATHIPTFDLPATTGRNLSLDSFLDKVPLGIVFLTDLDEDRGMIDVLNQSFAEFGRERSQLLVVAPVAIDELRRFVDDNDIVMPILADASGAMARDFGAHDESGKPRCMAVVATAEGRLVSRLDVLSESDVVETLLNELRDLDLGGEVEPASDEE
ncbi:MAG TPA: redoxin domain-containing protein [Acidimicrobiia bacterium]|nr:redoxin domain-containing protein [Acidimicrobiia bacterium]